MKNKYEHIFFDLDRTLWHFEENSKKVLEDIFNSFNLNERITSSNIFISQYNQINEELWAKYREDKVTKDTLRWKRFYDTLLHFGIDDRETSDKIGDYYVYHSPRQKTLLPYTKEVLEYLNDKYTLHIITNGFEEVQYIKMTESEINHYFDVVVLSERVGVKKPHPYIFKKAMKSANANAQNSLMIGDDLYADILGAEKVGMDSIYFNYYKEPLSQKVQKEISCLSELFDLL